MSTNVSAPWRFSSPSQESSVPAGIFAQALPVVGGRAREQLAQHLLGVGGANRLKRPVSSSLCSRLPECAITQSRRPHARWNGWVLASVSAPHFAVRMWSTKMLDASRSQAATSALRMVACEGAASFNTSAAGSPPG